MVSCKLAHSISYIKVIILSFESNFDYSIHLSILQESGMTNSGRRLLVYYNITYNVTYLFRLYDMVMLSFSDYLIVSQCDFQL